MAATVARQNYNRPSSAKLAGVKFELYHPRLPTLRRMEMDTVTHKLSTEHSRTSTFCSRDDFLNSKSTLHSKQPKLHCKKIIDKKTEKAIRAYVPHSHTDTWNIILASLNPKVATTQQPAAEKSHSSDLKISGLAMRSKHPNITSSWQYSHQPAREQAARTVPRPMSATMYSRYRTGTRPYTATPWR